MKLLRQIHAIIKAKVCAMKYKSMQLRFDHAVFYSTISVYLNSKTNKKRFFFFFCLPCYGKNNIL